MYLWFSASRINDPSLEQGPNLYPEEFGPYPEDNRKQLKGFLSRRTWQKLYFIGWIWGQYRECLGESSGHNELGEVQPEQPEPRGTEPNACNVE